MNNLKSLNDLHGMEGLSNNAHQDLEEVVRNLDKLGSPCVSLAQINNAEVNYE